jgi:hypothetical protein
LQVLGQPLDAPLQTYGAHSGAPAAPAGRVVQAPAVALQVWQGLLHEVAQHTPSTVQMLETHSLPLWQVAPTACLGVQVPAAQ